jgi:hypothetical protein
MDDIYDFDDLVAFIIDVDVVDDDQYISLGNSAPLINYHLTRSIPDRVLFEMMKNVPTGHGLNTEDEIHARFKMKQKFVPHLRRHYNSRNATKNLMTSRITKDRAYKTLARTIFHEGVLLVREESPHAAATLVMDPITGWCRHCSKYHFESCGESSLRNPSLNALSLLLKSLAFIFKGIVVAIPSLVAMILWLVVV